MNITKLVIMSVNKNHTVGYTDDGQFVKIPNNPSHKVGQIIKYNPPKSQGKNYWKMAIAVSILLVFFTGIINPFLNQEALAAYMSVGLNTGSVELWTDHNNKVVKTNLTSSIKELENLNLSDQNVYEAMLELIKEAKKRGLISETDNNILLVDLVDLETRSEHFIEEQAIKNVILKGLETNEFSGLMQINRHNENYLKEATKLNLTVSEYHIYKKSTAKGHYLTTEKMHQGHMRSILEEVGTTPEEIFDMHSTTMQHQDMTEYPRKSTDLSKKHKQQEIDHGMNNKSDNSHEEMQTYKYKTMHK